MAAVSADENRAAAARRRAHGRRAALSRRRPRAHRRHRVVVDRLPRLQPSAHPRRRRRAARAHAARDARRACARAGHVVGGTARGAVARRSRARVFHGVGLGLRRGCDEDGAAIPLESRRAGADALLELSRRLSWRHVRRDVRLRSRGRHAPAVRRDVAEAARRAVAAGCRVGARLRASGCGARARAHGRDRRAARPSGRRHAVPLARDARARRRDGAPVRPAVDLRRDRGRFRPHGNALRLRAGWRRARHHHAVEGVDGRHAAARGNRRELARLRGVSSATIPGQR